MNKVEKITNKVTWATIRPWMLKSGRKCWRVTFYGARVRKIIKLIYEYLGGKKGEADIMLACPGSGAFAEECFVGLKTLHQGGSCDELVRKCKEINAEKYN